jgi:hypothetical protein
MSFTCIWPLDTREADVEVEADEEADDDDAEGMFGVALRFPGGGCCMLKMGA